MECIVHEGRGDHLTEGTFLLGCTSILCFLATVRLIFIFTAIVHQAPTSSINHIDLKSKNYKKPSFEHNSSLSLKHFRFR